MYLKQHGKGLCEGRIGCTYLSKHSKVHTDVEVKKKTKKNKPEVKLANLRF